MTQITFVAKMYEEKMIPFVSKKLKEYFDKAILAGCLITDY